MASIQESLLGITSLGTAAAVVYVIVKVCRHFRFHSRCCGHSVSADVSLSTPERSAERTTSAPPFQTNTVSAVAVDVAARAASTDAI